MVHVDVEPPLADPSAVREALEAAIGLGQARYHLDRDEMPSRRAAVEQAARAALEVTLARDGLHLRELALLALEPAER